MIKSVGTFAVLVGLVGVSGGAGAAVYHGKTSDGERATVRTNRSGRPFDFHFSGFIAQCASGEVRFPGGPHSGFHGEFDEATADAASTEGPAVYTLDWFGTYTAYGRLQAHREGVRWIGTVEVQRKAPIVIRRGEHSVRNCQSEFRFTTHREPEPDSGGELTRVALVGGDPGAPKTLSVTGTPGPDEVLVNFDLAHGQYIVRDYDGIELQDARYCHPDSLPYSPTPTTIRCDITGLRVSADLAAGDDTATLASDGSPISAKGGGGIDFIGTGTVSNAVPAKASLEGGGGGDILRTGPGADVIRGGTGSDEVDAGAGDDLIIGGRGRGPDSLRGGEGDDVLISRDGRTDGWNYCGPGNDVEVIDDRRTDPRGFNCERSLRPPDRYEMP